MDRPTGVTILAVLNFLGAGLYILIGLLFILGMGILGGMMGQAGGEGSAGAMGMMMGLGAVAGVIFIVLSLIPLLIGWGLWKLKNWARIISIVLFALGALAALAGVGIGAMAGEMICLGFNLVFLLLYAWIIWYLTRPHVKQAFGAG